MKPAVFYVLPAILLIALIACSNTDDPVIDEDLLGVRWEADSILTSDTVFVCDTSNYEEDKTYFPAIRFYEDNQVTAYAACNTNTGSYRLSDDESIVIHFFTWTERLCPTIRAQLVRGKFLKVVIPEGKYEESNLRYEITDGRLVLYGEDDYSRISLVPR